MACFIGNANIALFNIPQTTFQQYGRTAEHIVITAQLLSLSLTRKKERERDQNKTLIHHQPPNKRQTQHTAIASKSLTHNIIMQIASAWNSFLFKNHNSEQSQMKHTYTYVQTIDQLLMIRNGLLWQFEGLTKWFDTFYNPFEMVSQYHLSSSWVYPNWFGDSKCRWLFEFSFSNYSIFIDFWVL